ncbi:thiamine pyrophosphokinase [Mytilus galloprovincialis]|nr:thiamine pyrophosphokinase [Mytilus galloprovincialis]
MTHQWNPLQYLKSESDDKLALILLNQPLPTDRKLFTVLWSKALLKVAVDGGANHLYNTHIHNREKYLPDLITGDFDSIQHEVKSYYEEQNVEIVETPDQNFTDFTKALKVASDKIKEKEIKCIIVLGSFGDRLDHMFANINSLYEASEITDAQIILVSDDTVAFLLQPGHHSISVDPRACGEWCGLIPVGEPCNSVTTTGLKWNLDKQRLKFGDLISSSNTLESESTDIVTVEIDAALLWTMVGCTVCLGLLLALPIAMIVIGSMYIHDCPAERYIPIYLIVAGSVGIIANLMGLGKKAKNRNEPEEEQQENVKGNPLDYIINCFLLAWFIAGNVWVYRTHGHFSTHPTHTDFCHPTVYWFAFWVITSTYILIGVICLFVCVIGCFAAFTSD